GSGDPPVLPRVTAVTEQDGGWVRPSTYRPGRTPAGGTDRGGTRRERREGTGEDGRPSERAAGTGTATTTRPPEAPPWAEAPTDPTPVVNLGGGAGGGAGRGTGG